MAGNRSSRLRVDKAEAPLDRGRIVQAALRLLEEGGAEAFSMRKLAVALDIKSPSLYWHVRDRDELFDLVIDEILGACPLPDSKKAWGDQLTALATSLRQVLLAHAPAVQLMAGHTFFGPNGLRLADHIIGVLRNAGFDDRTASYGYVILMFYVTGFVMNELAFGKGSVSRTRLDEMNAFLRELPGDEYPHLTSVARSLTSSKLTERFTMGLRSLMTGLDQMNDS